MEENKPVHTIVIDAGPLIKNDPSVSTLLKHSQRITTIPQVVSEIRDENARSRLDTTLKPFLEVRDPKPESVKFITDFSRRTGDLSVLSRPDILLLALTYDIECERNGGDWRLRRMPGQKGVNGSSPKRDEKERDVRLGKSAADPASLDDAQPSVKSMSTTQESAAATEEETHTTEIEEKMAEVAFSEGNAHRSENQNAEAGQNDQEDSDTSQSDGWITPSNLKKQQAKDSATKAEALSLEGRTIQAALLTSDFAMQNVAMQVNLNLLSPSLARIRNLKTYILRCHACFEKVKDMSKQFCPRCGKPSLTRVACSTNSAGEFKLHLKQNMQWNKRGDRYSIPKPVSASSSGKVNVGGGGKGGGIGGWGQDLILAEDQKEYVKAFNLERRTKERDIMDDDYLPSILTGSRQSTGARPRIGAGRNVNARKRK